ncbi:hypothetical protein DFH07DRAFT_783363 [Mycena maculata]|uniref:Uncharacterized protein n=1 Tax=Mycena maculata TaxID=230809 RepID=A0AAD7MMN4_9AGAR|nr:hypothetical protein DFH07DRAFT_783363 [Mycena maculata]
MSLQQAPALTTRYHRILAGFTIHGLILWLICSNPVPDSCPVHHWRLSLAYGPSNLGLDIEIMLDLDNKEDSEDMEGSKTSDQDLNEEGDLEVLDGNNWHG